MAPLARAIGAKAPASTVVRGAFQVEAWFHPRALKLYGYHANNPFLEDVRKSLSTFHQNTFMHLKESPFRTESPFRATHASQDRNCETERLHIQGSLDRSDKTRVWPQMLGPFQPDQRTCPSHSLQRREPKRCSKDSQSCDRCIAHENFQHKHEAFEMAHPNRPGTWHCRDDPRETPGSASPCWSTAASCSPEPLLKCGVFVESSENVPNTAESHE